MKRFFLLGLLVAIPAMAFNAIINCELLGTTYSTASPSLNTALKNFSIRNKPTIMVDNPSSNRFCFNTVNTGSSVAPTAGNGNEHCSTGPNINFYDSINIGRGPVSVYARMDVASCSTASLIDLDIW
jgi:hypothetical protein